MRADRRAAGDKAAGIPHCTTSILDGYRGMAEQVLAREAETQKIPDGPLDPDKTPGVVTMPEAVEDRERSFLDLPPSIISAAGTTKAVDPDAPPCTVEAPEVLQDQAPDDMPRPSPPRQQAKGTFSVAAQKKTKKTKKPKQGRVPIEGGMFMPLSFEELDSPAYIALGGNASKVYGYLKRTARTAASNGGGVRERDIVFDYTYSEAKRRGFSESTFIRAIKELWAKGFIDVIQIGGLRGKGRTNSQYKLAGYWKTYGSEWRDRTRSQTDPFAKTSEPKHERDAKW